MNYNSLVDCVKAWIEKVVIAHEFCPFAKREFDSGRIAFPVELSSDIEVQLSTLEACLDDLSQNQDAETSVLILPNGLEGFMDYLDFMEMANQLNFQLGYEGVFQLASFHPDYCFEDAPQDDPANYTNRSPVPLVHIIREKSIEKAISHFPDAENIPNKNIALARDKGQAYFLEILESLGRNK